MKRSFMDLLLGVKDKPFRYVGEMADSSLSYVQKIQTARKWLKTFELANLDRLRKMDFDATRFPDVTILTYTFPRIPDDYLQVEFAILHTWRMLGKMKTVIVADKPFDLLNAFASRWPDLVDVQYQPLLIGGDNRTISKDCLCNLHRRFSTEYCLFVQDDGFPLRNNLDDFLGKFDFIGAPVIRARIRPLELLIEARRGFWLNGGFSLRTHRLCEAGATAYGRWIASGGAFQQEDVFFSRTLRDYEDLASGFRFPTLPQARDFSATDIAGAVDIHARGNSPFGFHTPTTALQLTEEFRAFGYSV